MNDYVNKRREILQKKKEYEEYKNKRLGLNSNFTIKPTIPREFSLKTQSRSHSKSNSKKKIRENNIIVNQKREELKTFGYFNDGNALNYSNSNIIVDRSGNEQEDFIRAVNELHCRIDNLNI